MKFESFWYGFTLVCLLPRQSGIATFGLFRAEEKVKKEGKKELTRSALLEMSAKRPFTQDLALLGCDGGLLAFGANLQSRYQDSRNMPRTANSLLLLQKVLGEIVEHAQLVVVEVRDSELA